MENFIPTVNGVSPGNCLVKNWLFCQKGWKQADKHSPGSKTCEPFLKWIPNFFWPILFCQSGDNWCQNLSETDRQTDRQTDRHHVQVCVDFFFQFQFATSLLTLLAGGLNAGPETRYSTGQIRRSSKGNVEQCLNALK